MRVKLLSHVRLCDPMDCSLPGSSVHGILQARVLEWVAISFSRGSSQPGDQTRVSHIAGRRFTLWATREAHCMDMPHFIYLCISWWTFGSSPYLDCYRQFHTIFLWIHIYSIYIWLTPKNKDNLPLYFKNVIMYCNTLPLGNRWCMEKLPEAPGLTSGNSSNCYIHADVKLKRWKELTLQVLCLWHIHLDSTLHILRSGS